MKNPRKTQLPGHGRPLNYTPLPQDPDFIGYLFPNVLNPTTFNSYGVYVWFFFRCISRLLLYA